MVFVYLLNLKPVVVVRQAMHSVIPCQCIVVAYVTGSHFSQIYITMHNILTSDQQQFLVYNYLTFYEVS